MYLLFFWGNVNGNLPFAVNVMFNLSKTLLFIFQLGKLDVYFETEEKIMSKATLVSCFEHLLHLERVNSEKSHDRVKPVYKPSNSGFCSMKCKSPAPPPPPFDGMLLVHRKVTLTTFSCELMFLVSTFNISGQINFGNYSRSRRSVCL